MMMPRVTLETTRLLKLLECFNKFSNGGAIPNGCVMWRVTKQHSSRCRGKAARRTKEGKPFPKRLKISASTWQVGLRFNPTLKTCKNQFPLAMSATYTGPQGIVV